MVKMKMKFCKPNDGIYKVKMHLDKEGSFRIRDILKEAPEFEKLCKIKGERGSSLRLTFVDLCSSLMKNGVND